LLAFLRFVNLHNSIFLNDWAIIVKQFFAQLQIVFSVMSMQQTHSLTLWKYAWALFLCSFTAIAKHSGSVKTSHSACAEDAFKQDDLVQTCMVSALRLCHRFLHREFVSQGNLIQEGYFAELLISYHLSMFEELCDSIKHWSFAHSKSQKEFGSDHQSTCFEFVIKWYVCTSLLCQLLFVLCFEHQANIKECYYGHHHQFKWMKILMRANFNFNLIVCFLNELNSILFAKHFAGCSLCFSQ